MRQSIALAVGSVALAVSAHAATVSITEARLRPTPVGAPTATGYLTLTNHRRAADRLLGGSTPAAARVEVHEMSMTGGVMRMRAVVGGVMILPRQTVRLAPGGMHLMLISPTKPLRAGDRVPIELEFQKAGPVRVVFAVEP